MMKKNLILSLLAVSSSILVWGATPPEQQKKLAVASVETKERAEQHEQKTPKKKKKKKKKSGDNGTTLDFIIKKNNYFSPEESQDLANRLCALLKTIDLIFSEGRASRAGAVRIDLTHQNILRATRRYLSFFKSRGYLLSKIAHFDIGAVVESPILYAMLLESGHLDMKKFSSHLLALVYHHSKPYFAAQNKNIGFDDFYDNLFKSVDSVETADEKRQRFMKLIDSIRIGDLELIKNLIKSGIEINDVDDYDMTPLFYAVLHLEPTVVKLLLENKAGLNPVVRNGCNPLMLCVVSEGVPKLKNVIYSANKNIGTIQVLKEQQKRLAEIKELLLKNGVTIDATDAYGNTALALCAADGLQVGVEIALQLNADISKTNAEGQTPLHYLVSKMPLITGKPFEELAKIFDQLVTYAQKTKKLSQMINNTDRYGHTMLDYARAKCVCLYGLGTGTVRSAGDCKHAEVAKKLQGFGARTGAAIIANHEIAIHEKRRAVEMKKIEEERLLLEQQEKSRVTQENAAMAAEDGFATEARIVRKRLEAAEKKEQAKNAKKALKLAQRQEQKEIRQALDDIVLNVERQEMNRQALLLAHRESQRNVRVKQIARELAWVAKQRYDYKRKIAQVGTVLPIIEEETFPELVNAQQKIGISPEQFDAITREKIIREYGIFKNRFIQIMRTIVDGSMWSAPESVIIEAYWKLRNRYTQESKRAELLQEKQFNRLWYELYELSDHVRQEVNGMNYIKQLCHAPLTVVDFKNGHVQTPSK